MTAYASDTRVRDLAAAFGRDQGAQNAAIGDVPTAFQELAQGTVDATSSIQSAIDELWLRGGGRLLLPLGAYLVSGSKLLDQFWNAGVPLPAANCCLVLRPGVSLVSQGGGHPLIYTEDSSKTLIFQVEPSGTAIRGLELSGGWTFGAAGAGHGIFTVSLTEAGPSETTDCQWEDLRIRNVASYGIGLQNGKPKNCSFRNIRIDYIGADGLDLKSRYGGQRSDGNTVSDVVVTRHGNRVTGSAGVDCRGVWHVTGVTVTDFGAMNPALDYFGVRFRTKSDPLIEQPSGEYGSLSQFYVDCRAGTAAGANCVGVTSGSDDVTIANGFVDNPRTGVLLSGNSNGGAERNKIASVTVRDAVEHSFKLSTSCLNNIFQSCVSISAGIAGWKNEGVGTIIDGLSTGDAIPVQTATASTPSEMRNILVAGANRIEMEGSTLRAKGDATDIELTLTGKGAGGVSLRSNGKRAFFANSATGDEVNFIRAQSSEAGSPVELAVSGTDADVDLMLRPLGTGRVRVVNGLRVATGGSTFSGATGTFTTTDGKSVTVTGGVITGIA